MSTTFIRAILCAGIFSLMSFIAYAEKVSCPTGLQWTFEGYCIKNFDQKKDKTCPQGSEITKMNVTGPLVCKGPARCLSDSRLIPNAQGLCVEPPEAKAISRQYSKKIVLTPPDADKAK